MNWKQTIGLFLNADGGVVCNAFFAFLIVFFLVAMGAQSPSGWPV